MHYTPGSYDLHMHSSESDGALSPAELMLRVSEAGVSTVALTDHDTLSGLTAARAKATELGLTFINGVELTADWRGRVLHLVGLAFDPEAGDFASYMTGLLELRARRAEKIAQKLNKQGISLELIDLARKHAGEGQIGRPHLAQALVELGKVSSMQEAFDRYLGQGTPGDLKVEWPGYQQAVELIKNSGGYVMLAHPTKYNMTFTKLREVMTDLLQCGADGLEVSYPGVSPGHQHELLRLADQRDCWVSAGSDFHSPEQRWTSLVRYPEFESDRLILNAINQ